VSTCIPEQLIDNDIVLTKPTSPGIEPSRFGGRRSIGRAIERSSITIDRERTPDDARGAVNAVAPTNEATTTAEKKDMVDIYDLSAMCC